LPLALEQASAYVNKYHLTLAAYGREWAAEQEKVLGWYDAAVMQYPAPVAVTWQRSFERLKPGGITLLRLVSFLAPDPIPVAMFEGQDLFAENPLRDALAELEELSLLSHGGETFTVHRMVQAVVRGRLPAGDRKEWLERALEILGRFAPAEPGDVRTWPVWDPLRPHVAQAIQRAEEEGIRALATVLMNELGVLLSAKGLHAEAEPLVKQALAIDEASFGPDHPTVSVRLNNLGQLLKATHRLAEAEPLMKRALANFETSLGPDHPNTQIVRGNWEALLAELTHGDEAP
jgi:tetratricopeptide (TPR) repeat protein